MQQIALDKLDVRILEILQENCRIPRLELAEKVNLSPSQCFRRMKRLEDSGLIERFTIKLDKHKAGVEVSAAMMVQFNKTEADARQKLIDLLQRLPVVYTVHSITGEYDFMITVHCESMQAFSQLLNSDLQVSYVSGMHSYMLLECFKDQQALHLPDTSS